MKRIQPSFRRVRAIGQLKAPAAASTLAIVLGACSADVGRFDFPSFNLNGQTETSALPTPSEPVGGGSLAGNERSSRDGGTYYPDRPSSSERDSARDVDVSALPPTASTAPSYESNASYSDERPRYDERAERRYDPPRAAYQPPRDRYDDEAGRGARSYGDSASSPSGGTIEVARGDTLYGIARRNGTTVKDLMAANGLTSTNLRPGQRLRLPDGSTPAISSVARDEEPAPRSVAAAEPPAGDSDADWRGSYEIRSGDSLYRIARQYNVRVAELQRVNGISDPRQLRPGRVLRVPGALEASAPAVAERTSRDAPVERREASVPRYIPSTTQPTIINSDRPREVAALDAGRMTDAAPAARTEQAAPARQIQTVAVSPPKLDTGKLRWPARGRIIAGFGPRSDGTHNDGVNIAVPQGADVHVAEDGEVAYAGSELKGYGNLILVRHDNGWVTAYAHNDSMMVKRGDKVRRGDVIAKAGRTGQVDQPQIHFELRQGAKPVDPLPYLERL